MITFALLVAAFIALVVLPCLFANLVLNVRNAPRQARTISLARELA